MFSTGKKSDTVRTDRIDTIIGEKAVVEGLLKATDTTRVDGTIIGDGKSEGLLIIGETGLVKGNITAQAMLIAGTVQGNLEVKDKLEVTETGRIIGDIITKTLIIAEGASFEGKCEMSAKSTSGHGDNDKKEASVYDGDGKTKPEIYQDSADSAN